MRMLRMARIIILMHRATFRFIHGQAFPDVHRILADLFPHYCLIKDIYFLVSIDFAKCLEVAWKIRLDSHSTNWQCVEQIFASIWNISVDPSVDILWSFGFHSCKNMQL